MMKNRHLLLLLVSGLAVAVAPACGDPEDPATNNAPNNTTNNANNKNNPNNDPNNKPDECGTGKVKAAYNGGAEKCYTSCPGGSECTAPQVCKDADGATAKICVDDVVITNCQAGEVKASYQGGAEQCYKTCTDDASCGDAMKVCKAADGGGAKVCVMGQVGPVGPCMPDDRFKGEIGGTKPTHGGVYVTTDASYAEDAGIEAVFNYMQTNKADLKALADIDFMKMDNDPEKTTLDGLKAFADDAVFDITGATITATWPTAASQFALFVQDKKRALIVFVPAAKNAAGTQVSYKDAQGVKQSIPVVTLSDGSAPAFKVGQKVNFKVRGVTLFNGTPQVSLIEGVEVVSDNNDIYVQEMSGKDLDASTQWGEIVRVGGKLTSLDNESCGGGNRCFTLTHGANEDKKITLRTRSNNLMKEQVGACVTFIGPLGSFPAILNDSPVAQLDQTNFDWARGPFVERN